jgi:hypothetical protein
MMSTKWTGNEKEFLIENYPRMGKEWCMEKLQKSEGQIRSTASTLGLKQDKDSEFYKDWQERARLSKIGKKRPIQSAVMKKRAEEFGSPFPEMTEGQRKIIGERTKKRIAALGHPKGMLGKSHTKKTKEVLSQHSKNMWVNMSEEKRDAYSLRASIAGAKQTMNRANSSWKAAWRDIGSERKYYRSAWEANYARYLEWLKEKKQIADWKHEPKTFWFEGIKRGCMSYLPDFWVKETDGSESYHEVKGWMDDRSKTKIKRMAKYHPNTKLVVIDSKAYKILAKQLSGLIDGWEGN